MTGKSGSKRKLPTEIREPRSGLGDLGKLPEARNLSLTGSLQLWYHIPSTSGAGGDATDTDLAGNQLGENLRFFSSRNCKESKIIKDWPMKTIWPWKKLKKESIVCSIFRAHSSSSRFSMDARWQRFHRCMCRAGNGPCAKGDAGPALRPALIVNKSFYCTQCNLMKVHLISFAYIYIYMYITIYIYICIVVAPDIYPCFLYLYVCWHRTSFLYCLWLFVWSSISAGHTDKVILHTLITLVIHMSYVCPDSCCRAYIHLPIITVFLGSHDESYCILEVKSHCFCFCWFTVFECTHTYDICIYIYIYINIRIYSILS